jgi:hypothetical protein
MKFTLGADREVALMEQLMDGERIGQIMAVPGTR